jgi:type I restriction enzyme S subunit
MPTLAHREYLDVLPSEWEQVRLGDLGDVYAGSTPRRSEPKYWEGHIPWLTPSEVTGRTDKWVNKTDEYITDAGYQSTSVHLVPEGSLLVTTRATIGEAVIAGVPITTNQGFKNLVLGPDDDPLFYYYVLRFVADEMKRLASGSTFDEINKSDFTDIVVPRPNPSEQRRIADVLDTVDAAIQETDAVVEKQEQVKTGLLQDLLTRGLDADGRLRDPEREPEAFRETELGRLPFAWRVVPVGEVGQVVTGTTPKTSRSEYYDGPIPFARPAEVGEQRHVQRTEKSLTKEGATQARMLPAEATLVTCIGNLGRVAQAGRPLATNQQINSIIPASEMSSDYVYYASHLLRRQMRAEAGLQVVPIVNKSRFSSLLLPLPDFDEQRRIVAALDQQDETRESELEYRAKLQLLKTGLMQDLLTGRVRVPEAEDHVDEVIA